MDSEKTTDPVEDNRDLSRRSHRSAKKDSRASSSQKHKKNSRDKFRNEDKDESGVESRSKTRTRHSDPDRDQVSGEEGRRSDGSFYSEDYENVTPSERSLSPLSRSLSPSPSPTPRRGLQAKQISRSSFRKTGGVGRRGVSRPQRPGGLSLIQQHRRGPRSQSKESTPSKDLDLVTKRMLSARLLKINELHNSLSELQQRADELQKENRILKQLQARQERALQRYDDTESEISQLLSRHSNEIHVLRERLRRTQVRERAAERRLKDSEEQLQRSQATVARLKKLVDQRELGAKEELSRRLEEEKTRAQEAERKIKELERSVELSNSSYQRQLVGEKKKTAGAQEEIKNLREELERLSNKLKEKERELDARNIYANRMTKAPVRKEMDSSAKQKVPSRNSTKAVQTEDRSSSLDFPSPPPAISDASEYSQQAPNDYLSLKGEFDKVDNHTEPENVPQNVNERKRKEKDGEKQKEQETEQKQSDQDLNLLNEKATRRSDGKDNLTTSSEKEKDEDGKRKKTSSLFTQKEDDSHWRRGHVQEEVARWNQDSLDNQQSAEEMRRKKEHLLAKMREIDLKNEGAQDAVFAESSPSESRKPTSEFPSPRPPEQRSRHSVFNHGESEDTVSLHAGVREGGGRRPGAESGTVTAGAGRRALRSQTSSDKLAFGGYAPSFGHSASQASSGFPPPPPKEDRDSALEDVGLFNLRGTEAGRRLEKDKKTSLLQQLFGAQAVLVGDASSTANKMEVLNSSPVPNGVRSRREGLLSFSSGSSTPPASSSNTLQVAESKPAVRAIKSFDDEIEELTL
ncbi:lebercilin [Kryptolebias marmoratus]|uniref:Lebercilin LCA5 n=1 Tax=Kryptolebias marmoratus TaxID=37003 RepID=A0A3Q3AL67_KRYMA|nr:lebercilin [Kryptolebias marmoratus]XP_017282757.1 lebercilin [Kryptolebias marmoratus]